MADRTLNAVAFVNAMKDMPSEEVMELSTRIGDLAEHPGWEALDKLTEHARARAYGNLEDGPTLTDAQYARHIGWLAGLTAVFDVPDAVAKFAAKLKDDLEAEEAHLAT